MNKKIKINRNSLVDVISVALELYAGNPEWGIYTSLDGSATIMQNRFATNKWIKLFDMSALDECREECDFRSIAETTVRRMLLGRLHYGKFYIIEYI